MINYILKNVSLNQLRDLAFFLSNNYLNFPRIILLKGEVGTGKSTFAKEYIKCFKKDVEFQSPTYTICRNYNFKEININHIDFYRVASNYDNFVEELIENDDICLIEWPNEKTLENHKYIKIHLSYSEKENNRDISIFLDNDISSTNLYRFLKDGNSFIFKVCKQPYTNSIR